MGFGKDKNFPFSPAWHPMNFKGEKKHVLIPDSIQIQLLFPYQRHGGGGG